MGHVVVPLDAVHARNACEMAARLAAEVGEPRAAARSPHITVVSFTGVTTGAATAAIRAATAALPPFAVRAHGYGVFAGSETSDLTLHVAVVRTADFDRLHLAVWQALERAGAALDGVTAPCVWTPHVTLLDRHLTPARLGRAVETLAGRPHRRWTIEVSSLAVVGRRGAGEAHAPAIPLATGGPAGRRLTGGG
jgi:2'-5' RNA ligase